MLNPNQRQAIENIHSATLVIAGPGTGKTELLSERIGRILTETTDSAQNILCLTYSKSGVRAMQERLSKKYGKVIASEISVHTFHSFCNKIIIDRKAFFTNKATVLLDDIKFFEFVYDLLGDPMIAGINYSKKPPTSQLLGSFKAIFNKIKEEKLNIDNELINANRLINDLLLTNETIKRNVEINKIQKFHDALILIKHLFPKIEENKLYDYNDMLKWAIDFFNNNPEELQNYREKYLYVLVDEFQDTNPLQLELLNLLIIKNGQNDPSIFVVADDDQCIYRFQGASIDTIINLSDNLQTIERHVLVENYRSTQDILDMASSLIRHNKTRVVNKIPSLSKDLKAAHETTMHLSTTPEIWECVDKLHEAKLILASIQKKIALGEAVPSDFAILYRTRSYGETITDLIKRSGLEYDTADDSNNLLDKGFVYDIDNALQCIRMEQLKPGSSDGYLFKYILNHPEKYNLLDILELKRSLGAKYSSFFNNLLTIKHSEIHTSLFIELKEIVSKLSLLSKNKGVMRDEYWTELYNILSIKVGDDQIWKDWNEFLVNEKNYRFEYRIFDWAELFFQYREYSKKIDSKQANQNKGIKLSTLHGSKGLEFKHVYIVGCTDNKFEKPDKDNNQIKFPNQENDLDALIEDRRRLFYVGLTRAEQTIIFTYYKDGLGKAKNFNLTRFVKEAIPNWNQIVKRVVSVPSINNKNLDYKAYLGSHLNYVKSIITDEFRFSPSTFSTFIKCSSEFLIKDLFNLPGTTSQIPAFGTAVHKMLQIILDEKLYKLPLEDAKKYIIKKWPLVFNNYSHLFLTKNFLRYQNYGLDIIINYYNNYIHNKILTDERSQEETLECLQNGVKIKGKLDRIDIINNTSLVIDYKTGSVYTDKLKPFVDDDHPGGDYWRQAMFYSSLVSSKFPDRSLLNVSFHSVEKETVKDVIHELKPDPSFSIWATYLKNNWDNLQKLNFLNPCLKKECPFCNNISNSETKFHS
jgi:DNA helicase-2/ATP-dependent DNA helicase PcrA